MKLLQQNNLPSVLILLCLLPLTHVLPYIRLFGMPISFLVISSIILWNVFVKYRLRKHELKSLFVALIFTLTLILSLILSPVELDINSTLIKKYAKFIFFFLGVSSVSYLIKSKGNIPKIFMLIIIGVSIVCVFGLILNYNLHGLKDPVNVFWFTSVSQNSLGNWTPGVFLIGFYLLSEKNNRIKFLTGILLLIIIVTQFLAISRVGYFMIFISFFLWWVFFLSLKAKITTLICVIFFSIGFIKLFEYESNKAYERMNTMSSITKIKDSSRGRAANYVKGFDAFINYPILGIGLNNFQKYSAESIDLLDTVGYDDINEESHSFYVDVFAEFGIIGILIFSYFFSPILLFKRRHYIFYGNIYLVTKLSVWLIMLRGFTSHEFIANPINIIIFSVALFLSQKESQNHAIKVK